MCGIFGFALKQPVPMTKVFSVLAKLEAHQYSGEPTPVGGYGAGLAVFENDGNMMFEKVGKTDGLSPAKQLSEIVSVDEASILVGHVRMPSPEFMATANLRETAQPYVARISEDTVVSVHNGKVENYKELRVDLGKTHAFESEKVGLIDSEVIPHVFEKFLSSEQDRDDALYRLFCTLQGPRNAIAMLHITGKEIYLHFIHKRKSRGLTVWVNDWNEIVFCSRKEPLYEEFSQILADGKFRERISIAYNEDVGLKLSHRVFSEWKNDITHV
jgi:glucosamine 6-phosphate synthetase-like amidotransferase/phosphosugar isomerase protein